MGSDSGVGFVLLGLCLAAYFIPSIVAMIRSHRQGAAIFLLNLLLGWTLVGWVVALVWAVAREAVAPTVKMAAPAARPASATEEIERYAGLKDKGLITDEEYQAKKRQLMGL
jgi:hypothetical protein